MSLCIPLYPAVSRCIPLYPAVSRCISLYPPYPAVCFIPLYPAISAISPNIPPISPHIWGPDIIKNIRQSTGDVPDQCSSVDADSAARGGNQLVVGLGVETESIARCSAIMCHCENRILLSNRIELEVRLKFLDKLVKFYD